MLMVGRCTQLFKMLIFHFIDELACQDIKNWNKLCQILLPLRIEVTTDVKSK